MHLCKMHSLNQSPLFLKPICLLTFAIVSCCLGADLDPARFIVSGPGLDSRLVLPVRYIFVQLVDSEGHNVTSSRGSNFISVDMRLRRDG